MCVRQTPGPGPPPGLGQSERFPSLLPKKQINLVIKSKNKTTTGGRDKSGAWDEHTHTTTYKIDNQQGPTV